MPNVVTIDNQADRAKAIDILSNAGETYHRAPRDRFIVSDEGLELLHEFEIKTGLTPEEKPEKFKGGDNAKEP